MANRCIDDWMPEPNSGCWLWLGSMCSDGYGQAFRNGKRVKAHRAIYEEEKGIIPKGMRLLHKCDVRCCVNPDHLMPGTQAENLLDMKVKGRSTRGERSFWAKLTDAIVREIRESDIPGHLLAQKYGVSATAISNVRNYKTWEHV